MKKISLRTWLKEFQKSYNKIIESDIEELSKGELTLEITKIIKKISKQYNYECICKEGRYKNKEYLTIDYTWIEDNSSYDLPSLFIEHQNFIKNEVDNNDKLNKDFWKLLCVNSPKKILIGYSENKEKTIKELQEVLDCHVKTNQLTHDEFLIILGTPTGENIPHLYKGYFIKQKIEEID